MTPSCLSEPQEEEEEETKISLSAHCSNLQRRVSPRAKVPPPPLAVLDTLTQGGHADPISWCSTRPIGGRNTPHPHCIYLPLPRAAAWPPSNAVGCPSDNSLSRSD
ncbi:unnamed protein product [Pleuronectes platessa]|uniref:Uncharacterized protein n=1 Tax=Pleuronectes platessa TaxID=8262 RepID=A0A9N7V0B4_PLEPL|nr:unnamed protein product [Pleuronectes platessa]